MDQLEIKRLTAKLKKQLESVFVGKYNTEDICETIRHHVNGFLMDKIADGTLKVKMPRVDVVVPKDSPNKPEISFYDMDTGEKLNIYTYFAKGKK